MLSFELTNELFDSNELVSTLICDELGFNEVVLLSFDVVDESTILFELVSSTLELIGVEEDVVVLLNPMSNNDDTKNKNIFFLI